MRFHLAAAAGGFATLLLASTAMAQVTGVTGGSQPINNYQPSLVLTETVQTQGAFPIRDCPECGAQNVLGMVHTFAGNFGPYGQPLANGQLLSIQQNTALFSILGTTYGGNGTTNYALPNLAGQAVMGTGAGPGLSPSFLGEQTGTPTNVMTLSQLPAHDHTLPGGGVTGFTGGNQPLNNMQPTLTLNYEIAVSGIFPSQGGGSGVDGFLGQVNLFAGNFASPGYLLAQGQTLSINDNQALFAVLGTTYGGDGQTTFNLPDLRGRVIVGTGNGVSLGEVFGGEDTTLTNNNLPSHDHTLPGGGVTGFDGGGQPFNNDQPSLGLNYLIALQGVFPTNGGGGGDPGNNEPTLGEIIAFAGNFAPSGYALAQGQLLSIAQNQALFAILGTTYGGDGRATFALPDLRDRTIVGAGGQFILGQTFGENTDTLNVNQLAAHVHSLPEAPEGGVPEPATWAMMLLGFAGLGAALRRRRGAIAKA